MPTPSNSINLNTTTPGAVTWNGASAISTVGGTTGQVLQAVTSAVPTYSTATYPSTTTAFDLLCSTSANVVGQITAGSTGTVLIGTTSAVPSFSATPAVTSITFGGTALSVYQEGTWTPTLTGVSSAGTTTYSTQIGNYTRIGNIVYIQFVVTATVLTGTGNAMISNLPFTVKNQSMFPPGPCAVEAGGWTWPAGSTMLSLNMRPNTTTAYIEADGSAYGGGFLQMTNSTITVTATAVYTI